MVGCLTRLGPAGPAIFSEADIAGTMGELIRFKGDPFHYHRECRSAYSDSVESFFTELLQNALDAGSKMAKDDPSHRIEIKCEIKDVFMSDPRGSDACVRRVLVHFRG